MKIGRSTVFEWMTKGILVDGKHYFKHGRTLRFAWSDELLLSLLETPQKLAEAPTQLTATRRRETSRKSSFNWDY